jgi:hypothetical protein
LYSPNKAHWTRLRAPYVNPLGFRFRVYRKSAFSDLGKMLGMQDITIGDAPFDDAFIIQGNAEARVRELLADPKLRALIAAQPKVMFEVKDNEGWQGPRFPAGTDELRFVAGEVIKDIERLKKLFELFGHTLWRLCALGDATQEIPTIRL